MGTYSLLKDIHVHTQLPTAKEALGVPRFWYWSITLKLQSVCCQFKNEI